MVGGGFSVDFGSITRADEFHIKIFVWALSTHL
jgi:hypothetical protein